MLFNSVLFALFLPIVFILYWSVSKKGLKVQNPLLLLSSYFFYACWDWRFLSLLLFSTLFDYITGLKMTKAKNHRTQTIWFWLSVSVNVGLLGVSKYFNFFATSFTDAMAQVGWHVNPWTLNVILPVGISFYTFHGLSYVIDVYKGKINPEQNLIDYAVFVGFFPLLVAGPIERATHLLPQIKKERIFKYEQAVDGLRQILWGLFKKMVIADLCAGYANLIFDNSEQYGGSTLVIGALFFAFQIYGDFSGYSDIAIGTAKLFGIDLLRNFAFPYFSRSIAEFWRRWNMSLSYWFRDYVYIPLGGSRSGVWIKVRNTIFVFLATGFWHGANWTFIVWGLLNAAFMLPSILSNTNRNHLNTVAHGRILPSIREVLSMGTTFCLSVFTWIFFRARNVDHALHYVAGIFSKTFLSMPTISDLKSATVILVLIVFFLAVEWMGREDQFALQNIRLRRPLRWGFYVWMVFIIFIFSGKPQEFIYFQF